MSVVLRGSTNIFHAKVPKCGRVSGRISGCVTIFEKYFHEKSVKFSMAAR